MFNALTIDVEDYFQVENFSKVIPRAKWDQYESRVVKNTEKILDILDQANVKATFFILGWVGEKFPGLVEKIHNSGHEIASHGHEHRLIYQQGHEEFRHDLIKSKQILEQITRTSVLGYRAPSYSITRGSRWALDVLQEEDFKYDSSLFPIRHDRGGLASAPRHPHKIHNQDKYIWEFPLSTVKVLGKNIPFCGGGYFRLLPYWFIRWSINQINKESQPAVIYLHPWEFDPAQPRIRVDYLSRFRHYVNIDKTEGKLNRLLADFSFRPMRELLEEREGAV